MKKLEDEIQEIERLEEAVKSKITEIRLLAKERLFEIYISTDWHSSRYLIAKILDSDNHKTSDLLLKLIKMMEGVSIDGDIEIISDMKTLYEIMEYPREYEIHCHQRLGEILKIVFKKNSLPEARKLAGEALGYSKAKIWLNEMAWLFRESLTILGTASTQ